MEEIKGTITKIVWAGDDNAVIINVTPSEGKTFTALGKVENAKRGASVTLKGDWEFSEKRGQMQFKIKSAIAEADPMVIAATDFLSSGAIKGVGDKTACAIVDYFGPNLDSFMLDEKKLMSLPSPTISESKASAFAVSYAENGKYFTCFKLTGGDITLNQAKMIYDKYGSNTEDVLTNNPYLLVYDLNNFGFKKADKLALKTGFAYDGRERICAGLVCALKNASQDKGHCFLYEHELLEQSAELLLPITQMGIIYYQSVLKTAIPGNMADWRNTALSDLITNHPKVVENIVSKWDDKKSIQAYEKKYSFLQDEMDTLEVYVSKKSSIIGDMQKILNEDACSVDGMPQKDLIINLMSIDNRDKYLIQDTDDYGVKRFYERRNFIYEVKVAYLINNMVQTPVLISIPDSDIDKAIEDYEKTSGNDLGREQKLAVRTSTKNRISVITGGPGRGKTTILMLVKDIWEKNGGKTLLLAPTGRAAQRMSEATGAPAMTIHRALLSLKTHRNSEMIEPLVAPGAKTLIIIDECSMIDMTLANSALSHFKNCHICLVGDADQLPCVGMGDFFENVISSNVVPVTRLIECYRNSGSIALNSDIINSGGRIKDFVTDHMFKTVYCKEPEVVQKNILSLYEGALKKYSKKDICVLVPLKQNRKTASNELNKLIQEKFNPKHITKGEIKVGDSIFREGDRVMQTKNNYQMIGVKGLEGTIGVFNGETGEITKITKDVIKVLFDDGKEVNYDSINVRELSLAYALTVHKAQGSEYPCVITAYTNGDYMLLNRKIIYTAESRGKGILYLCGTPSAIQKAISNDVYEKRNTALAERVIKFAY